MKEIIRQLIRKLGFELKKYNLHGSDHALLKQILFDNQIDLIIDVGAHTGTFGNEMREMGYKGALLSFEPIGDSYRILNITAQRDGNWKAYNYAIGNHEDQVYINISSNSFSSSILEMQPSHIAAESNSKYIRQEKVRLSRLETLIDSSILQKHSSIMLKIDVQGFEMEVISGAIALLPYIKIIQMELSFVSLYEQSPLYTEVISKMSDLGFSLFTLIPEFRDPISGRLLQADAIFINDAIAQRQD